MAATIEDVFAFLKNDKEERLKEKEKDRLELKQLISDGVKKEVKSLIDPVNERVKQVESVQEHMEDQIKVMSEELKELREQLYAKTSGSQSVPDNYPPKSISRGSGSESSSVGQSSDMTSELLEIISLGRRTIGLHKIDEADLERMRQDQYGGAKTEEEERLLAVKEYLKCELKIDSETIESMEIERIFSPPMTSPSHLYVTFKKESSVARVFEQTRIMRSGSRILYYVPRQFKYRAKAIRDLEYQIRQGKNIKQE